MKTHKIGVMGGDGTGPEVTVEAVKVMEAAAAKFGFKVEQTEYDFGGERYMKTGEILPDGA
ncbi:MAG: isocitrate/isopropylmalate family dehydrogenase, partial [Planctomycetota bacterium]